MSDFRFTPSPPSAAGFAADALQELPPYLDALVANGDYPGFVTLLARGDQLVLGHATGLHDLESGTPLLPDAIFALKSMSKPFAAVAMMLLHEEGRWALDDPISKHLPEFAEIAKLPGSAATRQPSLREIFTHTAGFAFGKTREEMLAYVKALDWGGRRSLTEMTRHYASQPLSYEPGTDWQYSVATDLQAEIIERMTGERYDVFLKRRVFEPLGMRDTSFVLSAAQSRRLTPGYTVDPTTGRTREIAPGEMDDPIFAMGGSTFKSTALDYARFARMLLNRGVLGGTRVLEPESVDLMLSNLLSDDFLETRRGILHYVIGQGNGYAMNGLVCIDPERAGRPVGRGTYEWGGALSTWFWIDPENDLLFVGMTHQQRSMTNMRPPEVVAQEIVYRALKRV
jgi:CubicO group peptidase (beta-lactamase class C family)